MRSLKLPAEHGNLASMVTLVRRCAAENGFRGERLLEIELAVEEALVNIIKYAYPKDQGEVEVKCYLEETGSRFVIEITDSGIPFDLLSNHPPDLNSNLDRREVGGLGILLIRKIADDIQSRRLEHKNILRIEIDTSRK